MVNLRRVGSKGKKAGSFRENLDRIGSEKKAQVAAESKNAYFMVTGKNGINKIKKLG
jgi:hypothetical protein